jgi:hypothetical protein
MQAPRHPPAFTARSDIWSYSMASNAAVVGERCLFGTDEKERYAASSGPTGPTQPLPVCASHRFELCPDPKKPDRPTQTRASSSAERPCHPQAVTAGHSFAQIPSPSSSCPTCFCHPSPARRFPDPDALATITNATKDFSRNKFGISNVESFEMTLAVSGV